MPITSISRIQNRYGLSENVPQLSAAELGWVIDTRQLYIGNGPTSEGAPEIGNTEILTEYSDILNLSQSYTYKGEAAGYTVQTGATTTSPISRSMQAKFDDMASIRDFGAVGDGETDDTAAINRALYQLFCRDSNTEVRRSLFFPAGVYKVTDEIKIPTFAKIYGEGANCTIIRQTDADPSCVARTADSLQQIGANIGNNGALLPQYIDVNDMTFENTTSNHVFIINSTTHIRFQRVGFKGSIASPTSVGDGLVCVSIYSTAVNQSSNMVFEQCEFINNNFGFLVDDDVHSVSVNGASFEDLYKGLKLGENTTGSGSSVEGPKAWNISNCFFNNIYSTGLHAYLVSDIFSSFNHFQDVGNHLAGTPFDNVIIFGDDGCASVCDSFERTDAEDDTVARVSLSNKKSFQLIPKNGFYNGRRQNYPGVQITLADNTSTAATTGITFDAVEQIGNRIYYTAGRGSNFRHGELLITASSAGATISDAYQYDGADIGLTFSVNVSGGITTLKYVTTNTGDDVTFTYATEQMHY
jgi:hypothetical protein